MAKKLSEHFTLEELTYSDTAKRYGISNLPTPIHEKTLVHTCQYLLEPLRKLLNEKYKEYKGKKVKGVSIRITSGYRSAALNAKIGGAKTSEHLRGSAADILVYINTTDGQRLQIPSLDIYKLIKSWVKEGKLSVNQCIHEVSGSSVWTHVSHHPSGRSCDKREFLIYKNGKYTLDS